MNKSAPTLIAAGPARARRTRDQERVLVVHLVSTLSIGGLEMVVLNLAGQHDRDKFDLRVISLGDMGALAPRLESIGVQVESLGGPGRFKWSLTARLARRLREIKPHVLHTHNPAPHLHGALAAVLARVPVLVNTKHGRNVGNLEYSKRGNRLATRLSSCIVAVSHDAAQVALEVERVAPTRLEVIHNGIDLAAFPFRAPENGAQKTRAIHVARLNVIKDQDTLLRAVRRVVDAKPEFHLDLVGDGPRRQELEELSAQLELGGHVTFHGFRDDVRELLAAADFFVLSSISEGISLTLLEAMAVGLPVVATNVGGNPEVVIDGETGLLVPAQSPEKLAGAMLAMIQNPQTVNRMSHAARERVETDFDLVTVVRRYESLYLRLLGKKTAAP